MISEICLSTNIHEINQQYKQEPIMNRRLFELEDWEAPFEPHF